MLGILIQLREVLIIVSGIKVTFYIYILSKKMRILVPKMPTIVYKCDIAFFCIAHLFAVSQKSSYLTIRKLYDILL
jgi:hypothetical protein